MLALKPKACNYINVGVNYTVFPMKVLPNIFIIKTGDKLS
jgi:hypothetical protein